MRSTVARCVTRRRIQMAPGADSAMPWLISICCPRLMDRTGGDRLQHRVVHFLLATAHYRRTRRLLASTTSPSPRHRIFARGNLQKDIGAGAEQFPGQPPATKTEDNTKGMTFGDTWTINAKRSERHSLRLHPASEPEPGEAVRRVRRFRRFVLSHVGVARCSDQRAAQQHH